ncbi:MAG: hypothetical protein K6G50_03740 [bacterium]|nr:hypothetical protein [bacterium]
MAEKKKKEEMSVVSLITILYFVAVLLAVVFPALNTIQQHRKNEADLTQCAENLNILRKEIEVYKEKRGRFPQHLGDIVGNEEWQLKQMPKCPAAEKQSYLDKGYSAYNIAPGRFTVSCCGLHHAEIGLKKDEPYYNSDKGIFPASLVVHIK